MSSNRVESRVCKRILLWPSPIPLNVSYLFNMVLINPDDLVNHLKMPRAKKDEFHLILCIDCLNDLKDNPVFLFPHVTVTHVIYDNFYEVKWAKRRFAAQCENLQFCTIYELLRTLERIEAGQALASSNSIDQPAINAIISSIQDRIIAKRSNTFVRHFQTISKYKTTKLHGFRVDNSNDFVSCSSCEFVHTLIWLLQCGHRQCGVCMHIKKR